VRTATPAPLRPIGEGLWVADAERPFLGSRVPLRSTLIDVGGATLIHSPVPLTADLRIALQDLPVPRFIVAPNRWHHLYAGEWAEAYPQAELHGAPGLREKRPDLQFKTELGDVPPAAWNDRIEQLVFRAMPIFNEVVLFHPASRSLVVTDLAFHFQEADFGVMGLYIRAAGIHRRFGPSRITRRLVRDRALAREELDRILDWPFERVIVNHGAIVEDDARDRLRAAFDWL
jgi:hypothetical protein